jgi:hypothetical protein
MARVGYKLNQDALWHLMTSKRISPTDLISELGIKPRTFGEWAGGSVSPDPSSLHQLSRILGCDEQDLLEGQ